jgi:hypothetical protein
VLPIIVITRAWLVAHKFTNEEVAELLDLDLNGAVPAASGPRCPKCGKQPADIAIRLFTPDSIVTPVQAQRVSGRDTVACVCGTSYWYAAVHEPADDPATMAAVRAASVALTPKTGMIEIKAGDVLKIHVHDDITPHDSVIVQPGPATAEGGTCGPTVVLS